MAMRSESAAAARSAADDVHRRLLQGTHEALRAAAALAHEAGVEAGRRLADRADAAELLEERTIEHRASLVGVRRVLDHPEASVAAITAAQRAAEQTEALVAAAQQALDAAERGLGELAERVGSVASLLPADERPVGDILSSLPVIGARLNRHADAVAAALDETSEWLAAAISA